VGVRGQSGHHPGSVRLAMMEAIKTLPVLPATLIDDGDATITENGDRRFVKLDRPGRGAGG
jgi:hypothetical protein